MALEWILLLLLLVVVIVVVSPSREGFGGVTKKSLKLIPRSTCKGSCGAWYDLCMRQGRGTDQGRCIDKIRSCLAVCDYSTYNPT